MKDRYGISTSGEGSYPSHNSLQEYILDTTCAGIEDNIVGIEEESTWLMNQLIHGHVQRIIISIWGMGGLGKTTLVRRVYKKSTIKQEFDCSAWISVSQSYNVDDLLRKILKQLIEKEKSSRDEFDTMDKPSLIERMTTYLQDKRYLIVLDDLWSRDAWELLDPALVRNNNGSRIIITTRDEDVATLAYDEHYIQLKTLGEEAAWALFCTKAFPRLKGKACPQSVIHWAKGIVDKCEGLPLAIVTIGSLLSRKKLNENEWKSFYRQLDWQLTNNPDLSSVTNALDLSISHLQGNLKNCFLYCGIFPEDYLINREELIQLWIAESFVEERGLSVTMEEVADEYLKELVQRSLLQVVGRDAYGRADTFQMHDPVRDIVVSKCKSGKFSVLLDDARVTEQSRELRRVSVLKSGSIIDHLEGGEKIRSFLLFDRHVPSSWVKVATGNFKLLRVLSLRFADIETLPDVVTTLFNLHYLDLLCTNLKLIPKALCKLRKLQLLNLNHTCIVDLPLEISRLTKLRVLTTLVAHDFDARIFDCFQAAKVPPGICFLKDLQVLGFIELTKDIAVNLGNLTLMRKLSLMKVKDEHMKHLWTSIIRMPHLSDLTIISYSKEEVLNMESLDPIPNLEALYLKGKLQGGAVPPIFCSFSKLQDLRMGWSRMQTDPIPSFSHMLSLVQLHLYRVYEGKVMTFRTGWFPKLEKLCLADMEQLNTIEMEAGTIQKINYVKLIGLRSMVAAPAGFQYLTSLQQMVLQDMPEEFIQRLRGQDYVYAQHIPTIIYRQR